jgi:hypothetical protein
MLIGAPIAAAQDQRVPQRFDLVPITITGVTVENGQLFAHGLAGVNPFRTTLNLAVDPGVQAEGECPILNLQLGPIDLNLLGLRVATSPICLRATAIEGGGLLGDLLCAIARLLERGVSVPDALRIVQAQGRLPLLRNGLTAMLNQVFDRIVANAVQITATCDLLNLTLGPLDLNLLGLRVELENCSGGPVTLDLQAIEGGGLLGDLLCALGAELNRPDPRPAVVRALLWRISLVVNARLG